MSRAMAGKTMTARAATVALLGMILDEGAMLSQAMAEDGVMDTLPPQERARAQRLTLSVLRHLEQTDRILAPHLRKKTPPMVLNTLRLAVVEMVVEGAAAHGVVNEAVSLMRSDKRSVPMAGLVNAVLRKVADLDAPFAKLPPQRLPYWLRKPLVDTYGREAVSAIEAVQSQTPPLDLTLKSAKAPQIDSATALPSGSLRLTNAGQVSALAGYEAGDWWVQDAAAALAAPLLAAQKGERVLDLCAAPGGKTLQLAATGADVTALDISAPRLARLAENLARTGLSAKIIATDAMHWQPDAPFDAILLDAPCSATGTIRRHPDLPFVKDGAELAELLPLQAALLDRALGWLKPGGRLVYCTCSLLPDEGEAQLAAALLRHPDLTVIPPTLSGIPAEWQTVQGGLRLRPDYWAERGGMDGFFMVCLRKPA